MLSNATKPVRYCWLAVNSLIFLIFINATAYAQVETTVYDLLQQSEETELNSSILANIDGVYFLKTRNLPEPPILWQYNTVTGEKGTIPVENSFGRTISFDWTKVANGRLFLWENSRASALRLWVYTPGDSTAREVNLNGIDRGSDESIEFEALDEHALFVFGPHEQGGQGIWQYNAGCNCLVALPGRFKSDAQMWQQQNELLAFGAPATGEDEDSAELWRLDPANNSFEPLTTNLYDTITKERTGYLYILDRLGDKVFLHYRPESEERELWVFDLSESTLKEINGFSDVFKQGDIYYIGERKLHEQWFSFTVDGNGWKSGQIWLYHFGTDELKKVVDVNDYNRCDEGEGTHFISFTTMAFHEEQLFYRSNENGTGQEIWRYDLESGVKTDITPAELKGIEPHYSCWVTNEVADKLIVHGDQLYFNASVVIDPYHEDGIEIDVERSGLWHIDITSNQANKLLSNRTELFQINDNDYLVIAGELSGYDATKTVWLLEDHNPQLKELVKLEMNTFFVQHLGGDSILTGWSGIDTNRIWRINQNMQFQELPRFKHQDSSSLPRSGVVSSNKLYFLAASELSSSNLWQVGEKGVPRMVPVPAGERLDNVSIKAVTQDALLLSYRDKDGVSRYAKLNTLDNSLQDLAALKEATESNGVKQFLMANETITVLEKHSSNYRSYVYLHDLKTEETRNVFNDVVTWLHHATSDSVFVERYIDNQSLLWRWDIEEQQYYQMQEADSLECRDNIPNRYAWGKVATVANRVYLDTGRLVRYDPDGEQSVNFGCTGRIHGLSQNLLVFEHPENGNAALYRIEGDSTDKQWLADFNSIGERYLKQNNTLFFVAVTEEHGEAVFRYNEQMDAPEMVMQIQGELLRLTVIDDEVFVVTEVVSDDSSISSIQLWRSSAAAPVFDFNQINHNVHSGEWFAFAGDIWLDAFVIREGESLGTELVRLHLNSEPVSGKTWLDFDGDGKADIGFREKQERNWNILLSKTGEQMHQVFGMRATDIPVPADYDGDGVTDIAFRRPESRYWYVLNSSGSNYNSDRGDGIQRVRLGLAEEDIPVPADYDGDGITDMAVRRPSKSLWIIRLSSTQQIIERKFGLQVDDIPVTGDFDGDGKADLAFRRPGNKTWYIKNSSGSNYNSERGDGIQRVVLGLENVDVVSPADYDGDGITDFAVWRGYRSLFIVRHSSTNEIVVIRFNNATEALPVVADYDGDGAADTALYFPDSGLYRIRTYALGKNDNQYLSPANDAFPLALPLMEMGSHL